MAQHAPVDIDGIPVQLTASEQKRWSSGKKSEQKTVIEKIREERRSKQVPDEELRDPDADFNTLVGDL